MCSHWQERQAGGAIQYPPAWVNASWPGAEQEKLCSSKACRACWLQLHMRSPTYLYRHTDCTEEECEGWKHPSDCIVVFLLDLYCAQSLISWYTCAAYGCLQSLVWTMKLTWEQSHITVVTWPLFSIHDDHLYVLLNTSYFSDSEHEIRLIHMIIILLQSLEWCMYRHL